MDDDFEEHILSYSPEDSGLRLHGVNQNTVAFSTWKSSQVAEFGQLFGFRCVKCLQFDTLDGMMSFAVSVAKNNRVLSQE